MLLRADIFVCFNVVSRDSVQFNSDMNAAVRYGGKFERYPEPADLPHTCAGCCCSIFFIFILIFLAANTGVQAMAREEEMNFGSAQLRCDGDSLLQSPSTFSLKFIHGMEATFAGLTSRTG